MNQHHSHIDPEAAVLFLEQITANINTTRDQHHRIALAIRSLREIIASHNQIVHDAKCQLNEGLAKSKKDGKLESS